MKWTEATSVVVGPSMRSGRELGDRFLFFEIIDLPLTVGEQSSSAEADGLPREVGLETLTGNFLTAMYLNLSLAVFVTVWAVFSCSICDSAASALTFPWDWIALLVSEIARSCAFYPSEVFLPVFMA